LVANFVVAPLALDDIDDLTDWMRETDPSSDFDLRFIDTVYEAFQFLADNPGVGHKRDDLTGQAVLFWTVMKTFAVIYRRSVNSHPTATPFSRPIATPLAHGIWAYPCSA
jgi:plasmid stabilization system protein ParE